MKKNNIEGFSTILSEFVQMKYIGGLFTILSESVQMKYIGGLYTVLSKSVQMKYIYILEGGSTFYWSLSNEPSRELKQKTFCFRKKNSYIAKMHV